MQLNIRNLAFAACLLGAGACAGANQDAQNEITEQIPEQTPPLPNLPGNPQTPPDADDHFVSLNGLNNFLLHTGNLVGGESSYTVEFFVKFDQVSTTQQGQALFAFVDSIGAVSNAQQATSLINPALPTLVAQNNGSGVGFQLNFVSGVWYHIVVSYAANGPGFKLRAYLDGFNLGTGSGSKAYISNSERFEMGKPFDVIGGKSAFLKGAIDGLRISRGIRYTAGIITVPDRRNMPADASTIAVWNFNETAGDGKYFDAVGQKMLEKK